MVAMPKRALNFALDEKALKEFVPSLVGKEISYWDESRLLRGRVVAGDIVRDRYGKAYVEVEIEESGPETGPPGLVAGAAESPAP
jgi:hypothetical protein